MVASSSSKLNGPARDLVESFNTPAGPRQPHTFPPRAFAASVKGRSAEEIASDEDFWTEVRNEFTTDRTVINLNNGYASPAPRTVQEAMKRYLDLRYGACAEYSGDCGWRACVQSVPV